MSDIGTEVPQATPSETNSPKTPLNSPDSLIKAAGVMRTVSPKGPDGRPLNSKSAEDRLRAAAKLPPLTEENMEAKKTSG